jgi:hypothetical protein
MADPNEDLKAFIENCKLYFAGKPTWLSGEALHRGLIQAAKILPEEYYKAVHPREFSPRNPRSRAAVAELEAAVEKAEELKAAQSAGEKPPKPPGVGKPIYVSKELVRVVKGILTKKPHRKYSRKELAAEVRKPKWNYQDLPTDQNRQKTELSNAVRTLRREELCISRNPYQYRGTHTPGCDCFLVNRLS